MMTQVVTSLETWCRYEKIPFNLQREWMKPSFR